MNQLRREIETGELEEMATAKVRLVLDNSEKYSYEGKLLFSDATVDPGTGQVTLRAEFPNPKLAVLPGMYVRVQIEQGVDPDALAVPQQAIRRNDNGNSEIFLVREDNRAAVAAIRLGRAIEDRWLILEGVKPGDRVIVDGFQKFVAGDLVDPRPWSNRKRSASAEPTPASSSVSEVVNLSPRRRLPPSPRGEGGRERQRAAGWGEACAYRWPLPTPALRADPPLAGRDETARGA